MPRLLVLFSFVNLVIGSGAFGLAGILSLIATDLQLSLAAVGQAMTAYALATALLAPLVLAATARWARRTALLGALGLFTAGSVLCALAPSLVALLAGRVMMGAGAAFTPLAAGIAVALVDPPRRGQALALVFLGMSLSYVVGLPVASWIGFTYGWHVALGVLAGAAALVTLLVAWRVPAGLQAPVASLRGAFPLLARGDVLAVLGVTLLYFSAIFVVFSYIGPVLRALVPMDAGGLSLTLSLFGLAGVAGTLLGGAATDRFGPRPTLLAGLAAMVLMQLALPLTAGRWWAMLAVLLAWGCAGFSLMAPQQSRLAQLAPAQAPLLLSLNASMLYAGTAVGAAAGGALAGVRGLQRLSWGSAVFATAALLLMAFGPRLEKR